MSEKGLLILLLCFYVKFDMKRKNTSFWTHKANDIAKFLFAITAWRYF